jgi:hypothetical protein
MKDKYFGVEQDVNGILLNRDNVRNVNLHFMEGKCTATMNGQPRDRAWYLQNVLQPLVDDPNSGVNDSSKPGTWDDRKLRTDSLNLKNGILTVGLGITHYKAFREDIDRSLEDNEELQRVGFEVLDDKYAFFTRCPGVAGLVRSQEGYIFLGQRTGDADHGLLAATAGHLGYVENPNDLSLEDNLYREIGEFGLTKDNVVSTIFVGAYNNPNRGDFDFTFVVDSNMESAYFENQAWKSAAKAAGENEHSELIKVASMQEVHKLLEIGRIEEYDKPFDLQYSTRGALMSLRPEDF